MAALSSHNHGSEPAYGADPLTADVSRRFCEIFESDQLQVFPVATGTAANAISMAGCARPAGLIFASDEAHIHADEWGAAEFYTGGMKITPLPSSQGKVSADDLRRALERVPEGSRFGRPTVLSLTQASESGTVYSLSELQELTSTAKSRGMRCHMDGARFANALVELGCSPAEMTWKAGIDILSFGATKNGCWNAEAIVVFAPEEWPDLPYARMRAGHVMSKARFVAAQFEGYFQDDHWLDLARAANAAAARLAQGLDQIATCRLAWPAQTNEVFAILPRRAAEAARARGARFYEWPDTSLELERGPTKDEELVRLVTNFRTTTAEVDAFLSIVAQF